MDANLGQPRASHRPHSPHQLHRQVVKEIQLGLGIDNHQPVRFGHLRGNFCEMLGAGHANRDWKTNLDSHTAPYRGCNLGRRTEKMCATRTSAKASSMEIRSTRGVKSLSTWMAASPSRW